MLTNSQFERVYLARSSTDFRKSIDGLVVIVQECFELDPFPFSNTANSQIQCDHLLENGLNPFNYLSYLFQELPNIDTMDITKLAEFPAMVTDTSAGLPCSK